MPWLNRHDFFWKNDSNVSFHRKAAGVLFTKTNHPWWAQEKFDHSEGVRPLEIFEKLSLEFFVLNRIWILAFVFPNENMIDMSSHLAKIESMSSYDLINWVSLYFFVLDYELFRHDFVYVIWGSSVISSNMHILRVYFGVWMREMRYDGTFFSHYR